MGTVVLMGPPSTSGPLKGGEIFFAKKNSPPFRGPLVEGGPPQSYFLHFPKILGSAGSMIGAALGGDVVGI